MTSSNELLHDAAEEEYAHRIAEQATPSMTPKEYRGLFGEVVTADVYRLRSLPFVPDLVIDIGGNIGVFTRFARSLFPLALIVAVEPDTRNFQNLVGSTPDADNIVFRNEALGRGRIWRVLDSPNGAGECYLSESPGFPAAMLAEAKHLEPSSVATVMLDELYPAHLPFPGASCIIKIDCEGAENAMIQHEPSLDVLALVNYFVMEVHRFALSGDFMAESRAGIQTMLDRFRTTHVTEMDDTNHTFHAWKTGSRREFADGVARPDQSHNGL